MKREIEQVMAFTIKVEDITDSGSREISELLKAIQTGVKRSETHGIMIDPYTKAPSEEVIFNLVKYLEL